MASGRSGNQYFSHPTLWKSSYTYFEWTSNINPDRTRSVSVNQWMYAQLGYGIIGTWTFRADIGGNNQYATTSINIPAGGNGQANLIKLGSYSITLSAASEFMPSIAITTYANIGFTKGNGPGTSNVGQTATLESIQLPTISRFIPTAISPISTDTTTKMQVEVGVSGNSNSYYKAQLICTPVSGGEAPIVLNSAYTIGQYPSSHYTATFTGLTPANLYIIELKIIGLDTITRASATKNMSTRDLFPKIVSAAVISAAQSEVVLRTNIISKSALAYEYYLNDVLIYEAERPSNIIDYTFTGLQAGTTSYAKVLVTNSGGATESSQIALVTANAPPVITDVARVSDSLSIGLTVTASAANGIRGYAFSKDNGVTWTPEQISNIYVFETSILPSTVYQVIARVYDQLGLVTASPAYAVLTLSNPPVISSVIITNVATTRCVIKVTASAGAGIKGYYYSTDDGVSYTTMITASNYTVSGLTSGTEYDIKVKVVDLQNTEVESSTVTFTTLAMSPLDIIARFKPIKNYSNELINIPKADGQMIVTVDDGRIYLDYTDTGSALQRTLLGTSQKLYETTGTTPSYVITAPEIIDYTSGMTFYIVPHTDTVGNATLNINGLGSVQVYKVDGTAQSGWVSGRTYMLAYNATCNRFIDITS